MRDIAVMSIVLLAALIALRRPWIGAILWTWLSLMNPHRYTYGFAYDAPVALIAAASTLLGLLLTKDRESPFKGAPVSWFVALSVWITVSWLLGIDVAGDMAQWEKVMKINLMILVGLALMRTKEHVIVLAWVCTMSLALLGAKGGVFTIANGGNYRVWGPPDSFVGDNNQFALALVMVIPLVRFIQMQATAKWLRLLLLAIMLLCAAAAIGSHSRGALLAISAMALLLWWRGRSRFIGGIAIVATAFALVTFMPDSWIDRMETIETYQEDNSALGRFSAWWVSWRVAFVYPTGVGLNIARPELYALYSPNPELGTYVAHSIYFQVLGHHGFFGLFLFVMIWVATWRWASRLRKEAEGIPEARWAADMASMGQTALAGYLVGGAFLNLAYFDLPYYIMSMVVLARVWVQRKAWLTDAVQPGGWRALLGISPPRPRPGQPGPGARPGIGGQPAAPGSR